MPLIRRSPVPGGSIHSTLLVKWLFFRSFRSIDRLPQISPDCIGGTDPGIEADWMEFGQANDLRSAPGRDDQFWPGRRQPARIQSATHHVARRCARCCGGRSIGSIVLCVASSSNCGSTIEVAASRDQNRPWIGGRQARPVEDLRPLFCIKQAADWASRGRSPRRNPGHCGAREGRGSGRLYPPLACIKAGQ